MADVHDRITRSYNMSRIKSKNTTPERLVRKFLYANGFRFRLHVKDLPGKPDIVIRKLKTIIDVRGCFWHGHQNCKWGDNVKSDSKQIMERVKSARMRDNINEEKWKQLGWHVIIVWDSCELEAKKKKSKKREHILESILEQLQEIKLDKNKESRNGPKVKKPR